MKRKIAVVTAAVFFLQCLLPVCTDAIENRGSGRCVYAAETECETDQAEVTDTEIKYEEQSETSITDIKFPETKESEANSTESDRIETEDTGENRNHSETDHSENEVNSPETDHTEFDTNCSELESSDTDTNYSEVERTDNTTDYPEVETERDQPDSNCTETDSEDSEMLLTENSTDIFEQELDLSNGEISDSNEEKYDDLSEQPGNPGISAEKGTLYLTASCMNGSKMEEDVFLRLRSLKDLAEGEEDMDQVAHLYHEMLLTPLYQVIAEQYMELYQGTEDIEELLPYLYEAIRNAVISFEPVEIQFRHSDGSSYEPGEIQIKGSISDITVRNRVAVSESFVFPLWYDSSMQVKIPTENDYHISISEDEVNFSLAGIYRPSFFAVAELDRLKSDSLFETAIRMKEAGEQLSETETEEADDFGYTRPGTPCKESSAYTKVTSGSRTFSSAYTFLRGTAQSVSTMWYDSSVVTKGYQESNGRGYLIPKSTDAKGKFGFRITNVGYSTSARCNLDLYVTVTNFRSYCFDKNGTRVKNVFPYININKNLRIQYQGGLPDFELQCDIVKSGTTEKVAGNYRFMWTDIDGTQRYGFLPLNGKVDARYCLKTSTVYCGTETQFSSSYNMIYAQEDLSDSGDSNCSVMYETSSMSSFKIFVGQAGDGTAAHTYSSDTIKERYEDAADGVYNASTGSMMGWDGSAYGPTALPAPLTKYVSNDCSSWSSSNALSSVTSEYWYALELFVPQETAGYYYSQYQITDVLPAGTDYVGGFSVQKTETGESVSYFNPANTGDTVTVTASSAALNDASFYGYTYRIQFKVKMDPTENVPSYNGTTAVYTVANQASQTGKHISDSTVTTITSNTVTTTASENRPSEAAPSKWISTASGLVKEAVLKDKTQTAVFEVQQAIPGLTNAWRLSSFSMEDTLESCFAAERISVYLGSTLCGQWTPAESGASKSGWTCKINGQNIQMHATGGLSENYYGNTVRLVIETKIKSSADLTAYVVSGTPEMRTVAIPNQASAVFTWRNGSPASTTKYSDKVSVRLTEQIQTMSRITLTKALDASEIVWAHGNPTFTFCVERTDISGNVHRYYDTIEFVQTNTPTTGTVTQSAVFDIPSGSYRAYETNVIRYRLSGINNITNGQAAGVGVNFNITAQQHGAATFHNKKTTDAKLSDTAFIRNTIIE